MVSFNSYFYSHHHLQHIPQVSHLLLSLWVFVLMDLRMEFRARIRLLVNVLAVTYSATKNSLLIKRIENFRLVSVNQARTNCVVPVDSSVKSCPQDLGHVLLNQPPPSPRQLLQQQRLPQQHPKLYAYVILDHQLLPRRRQPLRSPHQSLLRLPSLRLKQQLLHALLLDINAGTCLVASMVAKLLVGELIVDACSGSQLHHETSCICLVWI